MLNFVENLLEKERDPRSGPMNDQDHSLSLSDPDRSLVLSHFLTNFLQNLASCQTSLKRRFHGGFTSVARSASLALEESFTFSWWLATSRQPRQRACAIQ
jgi:hypothetical protein